MEEYYSKYMVLLTPTPITMHDYYRKSNVNLNGRECVWDTVRN